MSELSQIQGGDAPRAVTWRSVGVGLCGVVFICGLAPYNDWVVNNTYVVGNFLPVGLLLFYFLFVVLVNAPLHWVEARSQKLEARRWRLLPVPLSGGELAVALGMTLVSCTLPGSGLMRYLPPFLVGPYYHSAGNTEFMHVLREANPPDWIYPRFETEAVERRAAEGVISDFIARVPVDEETFWGRFRAVPWGAWAKPAAAWGLLMAAVYGGIVCMAVILRRQWVENERLAFPLATIYLSLIEPPEAGRGFNAMFRSRGFWIAAGAVFLLHLVVGLHEYFPQYVPRLRLRYDFQEILTEEPWRHMTAHIKTARLYFVVVGLMFFVPAQTAFSLWFFFIVLQWTYVGYRSHGAEYTVGMRVDEMFGGVLVFGGVVLWLGRKHWGMVVREMFRGIWGDRRSEMGDGGRRGKTNDEGRMTTTEGRRAAKRGEVRGRYLPYSVAGWGFVVCLLVIMGWLVAAGVTVIGSVVIVGMLFLLFLVIARVAAETGVLFAQLPVPVNRPWIYLLQDLPWEVRTSNTTFFMGAKMYGILGHDLREAASVYVTHALRVADGAGDREGRRGASAGEGASTLPQPLPEREGGIARGMWFVGALMLALAVGFVVAGGSMLYIHYSNAATLDQSQLAPISPYAVEHAPRNQMLIPSAEYVPPRSGPVEAHNRLGYFGFGAVLTGALAVLRLRYVGWPLHPVGYLLMGSHAILHTWFSIFLGWGVKVLIVRFGGAKMFRSGRYFFIGMIMGEVGAAAFWLVTGFVRNLMGLPYYPIHVLVT